MPVDLEPEGYRGQHNAEGNDRGQHNPEGLERGQQNPEGLRTAAQAVAARRRLGAYEGRWRAFWSRDGSQDLSVPIGRWLASKKPTADTEKSRIGACATATEIV